MDKHPNASANCQCGINRFFHLPNRTHSLIRWSPPSYSLIPVSSVTKSRMGWKDHSGSEVIGSMCMSVMSGYILINYWSVTSTHKSTWSGRLESKSSISTLTPLPPLSSHTDAHKCQLGKLGQVGAEKNQIRDESFSGKFRVVSPPFSSLLPFSLSSSTSYSDAIATLF